MGYRSKVIFGIVTEEKNKIDNLLKKHSLLDVYDEIKVGDFTIYSSKYDRKWYDMYSDVNDINELIQELSYDDKAFMVCLGEDGELHNEEGVWFDFVGHVSYLEIYNNQ